MGKLGWVIGAGIVGGLIHNLSKEAKKQVAEEERRKQTPCLFVDGFSQSDFAIMATRASMPIKRLSVSVDGPIIYGTVQSQSGISEWSFKVDFNDYGHITGHYWLSSDNQDSKIPEGFADKMVKLIQNFDPEDYDYDYDYNKDSNDYLQSPKNANRYCPNCGEQINVPNSVFCSYCGKRLT